MALRGYLWAAITAYAVLAGVAHAQHISIDGTLSPARTLTGPNYTIGAPLGKQVGGNLFQSFGTFSLSTGESATFTGPASVTNVIGRVTGGLASSINGSINSAIPGANVYLINPAGVTFGANAQINVSGSFHASSADYIKLADGGRFQATSPNGSSLSAAAPQAFGFLSANPAAITVNGSTLSVPSGQTLGLSGGQVSVIGARLSAPTGTIWLTGVASTGEIPAAPASGARATVTSHGPVSITGGAVLDVSDPISQGSGGGIRVRAGTLLVDGSEINADNYGTGGGAGIALNADTLITVRNGAYVHAAAMARGAGGNIVLTTGTAGTVTIDGSSLLTAAASGAGGGITISSGSVIIQDAATVSSTAAGTGDGGAITINAPSILLDDASIYVMTGTSGAGLTDAIGSPLAAGTGGAININATSLTVQNGASISTVSNGDGAGGALNIAASSIDILSEGSIQSTAFGAGQGGGLTINGGSLTVQQAGSIATVSGGDGAGGNIALNLTGAALVTDPGSTIFSTASGTGPGGSLSVSSATLTLQNVASMSSSAASSGNGGAITINAASVLLDGGGTDLMSSTSGAGLTDVNSNPIAAGTGGAISISGSSLTIQNGATLSTASGGDGAGGGISITASNVSLLSGASIFTFATSTGASGTVQVNTAGTLLLDGTGTDGQGSTTTITSSAFALAGAITIAAQNVSLLGNTLIGGGFVLGSANGADVAITATSSITIDGTSTATGGAFVGASASGSSTGNAGAVTLSAPNITLKSGANIYVPTDGPGGAGVVRISATTLLLDGTSSGASNLPAGIVASSDFGASGAAGSITINADHVTLKGDASISTSTSSSGPGGNIQITAGSDITVDGSSSSFGGANISASTAGTGNGGSVTLTAPQFTLEGGGQINVATSSSGAAGSIVVNVSSVLLDGTMASPFWVPTQISAQSIGGFEGSGFGPAGSIQINAQSLTLRGDASISSTTFADGPGGNVTVIASGDITIDGSLAQFNGASISASAQGSGNGGSIALTARNVTLMGGGQIVASTISSGAAGNVTINVPSGQLLVDGTVVNVPGQVAQISTQSNIAGGTGAGPAGSIVVNAQNVTLLGGATISTTTSADGMGGDVTITASDAITVNGALALYTGSLAEYDGASISAMAQGSGVGGSVHLTAENISLIGSAQINASTSGPGAAGNIYLTVAATLLLDGTVPTQPVFPPEVSSASGFSGSPGAIGLGSAGSITIGTQDLLLRGNSGITSNTYGDGKGGDITINAAGTVTLDGTQSVYAGPFGGTVISSATSGIGNAGQIAVTAQNVAFVNGGLIDTSTYGSGAGGNINLIVAGSLSLDGTGQPDSRIAPTISSSNIKNFNANTNSGIGPAGSVSITAHDITLLGGSVITTDTLTTGGAINIRANAGILISQSSITSDSVSGGLNSGSAGAIAISASDISVLNALILASTFGAGSGGDINITVANGLSLYASSISVDGAAGPAGSIGILADDIHLQGGSQISAFSFSFSGVRGGQITISATGNLTIDGSQDQQGTQTEISTETTRLANAGSITITAGNVSLINGGQINTATQGAGPGGSVQITSGGTLLLDGTTPNRAGEITQISATSASDSGIAVGNGPAGSIVVNAHDVILRGDASISSTTYADGQGGSVSVTAANGITVDGSLAQLSGASITASAQGSGDGGSVALTARNITLMGGGQIVASTGSSGAAGNVTINVPLGQLLLDGTVASPLGQLTQISAQSGDDSAPGGSGFGSAGSIIIKVHDITLRGDAAISTSTYDDGHGGIVTVTAADTITLDGAGALLSAANISAITQGSGDAGNVNLTAQTINLLNGGGISTTTYGSGAGGDVTVTAQSMSLLNSGISSNAHGSGPGGAILITTSGDILADNSSISTFSDNLGDAGSISISATNVTLRDNAQAEANTYGGGRGGDLTIIAAGSITIDGTASPTQSGIVQPESVRSPSTFISASTSGFYGPGFGQGGDVAITAQNITLMNGGYISTDTFGSGPAGGVRINTSGTLLLDGTGGNQILYATYISSGSASNLSGTGPAGSIVVNAQDFLLRGDTYIATDTNGDGRGGDVTLNASGAIVVDGSRAVSYGAYVSSGTNGSGDAGRVNIRAQDITLLNGGQINTSTTGAGAAGSISVTTAGMLLLDGTAQNRLQDTTSISSNSTGASLPGAIGYGPAGSVSINTHDVTLQGNAAISTNTYGDGRGGDVTVTAMGDINLLNGAIFASSTFGAGQGGSVIVQSGGTLIMDGEGTSVAAATNGSGAGGSVAISAVQITIQDGGQIASSAFGSGNGGSVNVNAVNVLTLIGTGPQIAATSGLSGNAGTVTVSAVDLQMSGGASISTEATEANGGNIAISIQNLMYLRQSSIVTTVDGSDGNGGNIIIDPHFVILDNSLIQANAFGGNGGNITITADQFIPSAGSVVQASSAEGISGAIAIRAPADTVTEGLIDLSKRLGAQPVINRVECFAIAESHGLSGLVPAGRGGLPDDGSGLRSAQYFAGRRLSPAPSRTGPGPISAVPSFSDTTKLGSVARVACR